LDVALLIHGTWRRPAAADEHHLGRHLRQRVEDTPDAVVHAPCATMAWSMDRDD
jgi:hypothetical protein